MFDTNWEELGKNLAKETSLKLQPPREVPFFATSAKTGKGIEEVFQKMALLIKNGRTPSPPKPPTEAEVKEVAAAADVHDKLKEWFTETEGATRTWMRMLNHAITMADEKIQAVQRETARNRDKQSEAESETERNRDKQSETETNRDK